LSIAHSLFQTATAALAATINDDDNNDEPTTTIEPLAGISRVTSLVRWHLYHTTCSGVEYTSVY
jgi:hypothetical protein